MSKTYLLTKTMLTLTLRLNRINSATAFRPHSAMFTWYLEAWSTCRIVVRLTRRTIESALSAVKAQQESNCSLVSLLVTAIPDYLCSLSSQPSILGVPDTALSLLIVHSGSFQNSIDTPDVLHITHVLSRAYRSKPPCLDHTLLLRRPSQCWLDRVKASGQGLT